MEDKASIEMDDEHIEMISGNVQQTIHAIIWPGMAISSIVFALFLLDMTLDSNDNDLSKLNGVASCIMLVALLALPLTRLQFYRQKKILEDTLDRNMAAHRHTLHQQGQGQELVEMIQGERNTEVENPMHPSST